MKLNVEKWKEFLVKDIFDIKYGVNLELIACEESNDIDAVNFVSRTEDNNGISAKVRKINGVNTQKAGLITVAGGGSVLSTFVQPDEFYSGRDLYTLDVKANVSEEVKYFLTTIITLNKYKYSYGRQANKTLPFLELKLPIQYNLDGTPYIDSKHTYSNDGYVPDWQFMEDYMKSLHYKPITTKNTDINSLELKIDEWKEFTLDALFILKSGFYNKKPEHAIDGRIPFLASTESNNGVTEFYSIEDIRGWDKVGNEDNTLDKKMYAGNCIVVTVDGSICNAFYQSEKFTCSHSVTAFYIRDYTMNPYLAMFLCTIIIQDKYRWSYGRKPHDIKKFGKSTIKLPIKHNQDGTSFIDKSKKYSDEGYVPDWEFMENYIKSLPYGDRI